MSAFRRYSTLLLLATLASTAACAEILGIRPPGRRPFDHRSHVLKGIGCNRCHAGIAAAGEDGPLHLPTQADCTSSGCHDKPHDEGTCLRCHSIPAARAGVIAARHDLTFQHKKHMPRVHGNCMRCHLDIETGADILRPRMATCGGCHNHGEQIVTNQCSPCHKNLRDEGNKPEDHLIHTGNFLREHGVRAAADRQSCANCHAEKFCVSCHGVSVPKLPERLKFDDPRGAGIHRAGFKSRHAEEARADPGLCTTCHTPKACSDCHNREKLLPGAGGKSPHPSGWLGVPGQRNDHGRAAWREPEICAACHSGAGEMLCVGCHKVGAVGGNPHVAGFTSRKPKTDRPCRLCHMP